MRQRAQGQALANSSRGVLGPTFATLRSNAAAARAATASRSPLIHASAISSSGASGPAFATLRTTAAAASAAAASLEAPMMSAGHATALPATSTLASPSRHSVVLVVAGSVAFGAADVSARIGTAPSAGCGTATWTEASSSSTCAGKGCSACRMAGLAAGPSSTAASTFRPPVSHGNDLLQGVRPKRMPLRRWPLRHKRPLPCATLETRTSHASAAPASAMPMAPAEVKTPQGRLVRNGREHCP
mmetsp:Transcript_44446/g.141604  ORF Transcript_44446/g.141604 Transcript_44446/m.141604 type:complete len:244 (+) Transcript_44446:628-1359(+)